MEEPHPSDHSHAPEQPTELRAGIAFVPCTRCREPVDLAYVTTPPGTPVLCEACTRLARHENARS